MVRQKSISFRLGKYTVFQDFKSITYKYVINQRTLLIGNLSVIMKTPGRAVDNGRYFPCIGQMFWIPRIGHVPDNIRFRRCIKITCYDYRRPTAQFILYPT